MQNQRETKGRGPGGNLYETSRWQAEEGDEEDAPKRRSPSRFNILAGISISRILPSNKAMMYLMERSSNGNVIPNE